MADGGWLLTDGVPTEVRPSLVAQKNGSLLTKAATSVARFRPPADIEVTEVGSLEKLMQF